MVAVGVVVVVGVAVVVAVVVGVGVVGVVVVAVGVTVTVGVIMNTAQKGAALEREIRQLLQGAGWSVIRGAASKGEFLNWKADLVASKATDHTQREVWIAVLQCKVKKVTR